MSGERTTALPLDEDGLTLLLAPKVLDIVEHEAHGRVVNLSDDARAGMWARSMAKEVIAAIAADVAPRGREAIWEKWTGGERLAYGCGYRDARADALRSQSDDR